MTEKICGILTEASISFETGMLDFAVVGMGINVYSVKDSFDDELLKTASSIEDECGVVIDRSKLCAEILSCFEKNLGLLENHQFIDEYRKTFMHSRKLCYGNKGKFSASCICI